MNMNMKMAFKAVCVAFFAAGLCFAGSEPVVGGDSADPGAAITSVDAALKYLELKTSQLTSYEGGIVYRYRQPLLESESLRRGAIFYAKYGAQYGDRAFLRINFQTLKQDDEKEQKYLEQYIFDGVWLTKLNYQIKSAEQHQLAEEDKPADAFDLASEQLPVIGFTKIDTLKRDFEIRLVKEKSPQSSNLIRLHLKTKPQSRYKDNYTSIDFWMDRKLGLPAKVVAMSTEEEVYEIELVKPKINKGVDKKVFEYRIPNDFGAPVITPLKKAIDSQP